MAGEDFALISAEDSTALVSDAERSSARGSAFGWYRFCRRAPAPDTAGAGTLGDIDGVRLPLLAETGSTAVLVRPDHYVFGGAAARAGVGRLVAGLSAVLSGPVSCAG